MPRTTLDRSGHVSSSLQYLSRVVCVLAVPSTTIFVSNCVSRIHQNNLAKTANNVDWHAHQFLLLSLRGVKPIVDKALAPIKALCFAIRIKLKPATSETHQTVVLNHWKLEFDTTTKTEIDKSLPNWAPGDTPWGTVPHSTGPTGSIVYWSVQSKLTSAF